MESEFQDYYTVIAIDKDRYRCFIKFIGIFSNYELAKDVTIYHHNDFGNMAKCSDKYEYKIFMGNLNENVEIDTEDDLLSKEKEKKYYEENKEKIEIQRKEEEETRIKMEKEKETKIKHVTEIFNKIACNKYYNKLTVKEMDHVIDFFDKYEFLIANDYVSCNRKFVTESLKNFEVIFKLERKGLQTNDYLCNIMDTYRKHGIKITA